MFLGALFAVGLFCCGHIDLSHTPDETPRLRIPFWIFENKALPTGYEPELTELYREPGVVSWGFNYAFNPYLPSIVATLVMKATSMLVPPEAQGPDFLMFSARLVSLIALVVTAVYAIRLSGLLFEKSSRKVFVLLIVGIPQVLFLSCYLNNDIFSLMATVMIVYYVTRAHRRGWDVGSCVGLGVSYSISLLSYYFGYGTILVTGVYAVVDCLRGSSSNASASNRAYMGAHSERKGPGTRSDVGWGSRFRFLLSRAGVVLGIMLLLAGWYFVRNAIIYDGDFLGMAAQRQYAHMNDLAGYNVYHPPTIYDLGLTWQSWFGMTLRSLVGVFGYMDILMPDLVYLIYGTIVLVGIALYLVSRLVHVVRGMRTPEKAVPADDGTRTPEKAVPADDGTRTLEKAVPADAGTRTLEKAVPADAGTGSEAGAPEGETLRTAGCEPERLTADRSFLPLVFILACIVIPFLLSMYRSATYDYVPQGRYVISALPFIAYMVASGFERLRLSRAYGRACEIVGLEDTGLLDSVLCVMLAALWCYAAFGYVVDL